MDVHSISSMFEIIYAWYYFILKKKLEEGTEEVRELQFYKGKKEEPKTKAVRTLTWLHFNTASIKHSLPLW